MPVVKGQNVPSAVAKIGTPSVYTKNHLHKHITSPKGATYIRVASGFTSLLKGFIKGHLDLSGNDNERQIDGDINITGQYYTGYVYHEDTGETSLYAESYSLMKYYDANSIESFYTSGTGNNYEKSSTACCIYILYE
jgi:hypothetical protein